MIEEKSQGMTVREEDKEFIANFYKFSFVGIVIEWIERDMKHDPKEIVERLNALIAGSFEQALSNAKLNK